MPKTSEQILSEVLATKERDAREWALTRARLMDAAAIAIPHVFRMAAKGDQGCLDAAQQIWEIFHPK